MTFDVGYFQSMDVYRQGNELYFCRMGDSLVVFHEDEQEYFKLNETGAAIWELLHEPLNREQLVGRLSADFDVGEEVCRVEVDKFLSELVARRLVVCSDSFGLL